MQSGGCAEYANLVVSVFNDANAKTTESFDKSSHF